MAHPLIIAEEISVHYPKAQKPALAGVGLRVAPGEWSAIVGPNGAGKSTLLMALAGTVKPSSGTIEVAGHDPDRSPRTLFARDVAVVRQFESHDVPFSVREVVRMGRAPHQGAWLIPTDADESLVESVLARCDLEGLADRTLAELSGGEQRRVTIARALCQAPKVLLLDEPTAHLDVRHAIATYELVRKTIDRDALACVVVMHDFNMALQYADSALLLADGAPIAEGPTREVLTQQNLEHAFDQVLERVVFEGDASRAFFMPMRPRESER